MGPPSLLVLPVLHLGAYRFYQNLQAFHLHLVPGSQPLNSETSATGETLGRRLHFLSVHFLQ